MTFHIRPRRAMYGGADSRRMRYILHMESATRGAFRLERHSPDGTYTFRLPTGEKFTIPKNAVIPFVTGVLAVSRDPDSTPMGWDFPYVLDTTDTTLY